MLYICATPIGNLEDITLRVLRVLREVDLIVAEDTRQTRKLLNHYQISRPLTSLHKFNEHDKAEVILELLREGKQIALVSDAGTPGISDPGAELISKVIAADLPLTVLPGANACITAIVQSGLLQGPFYFHGFLPRKQSQAAELLNSLAALTCPLVFYEAPHRLLSTLTILETTLGDRLCAVARELTKKFEEVQRGTLSQLRQLYTETEPRGEFVIVVAGANSTTTDGVDERLVKQHLAELLAQGVSRKDAVRKTAEYFHIGKNEVYQYALEIE